MQPIYVKEFEVSPVAVDQFGRLKASRLLAYLQDVAGDHSAILGTDQKALTDKNLFWAVIRHRVQITRLPQSGEKLRIETWPMPTTRTAYPRSTIAYDEAGNECFRSIKIGRAAGIWTGWRICFPVPSTPVMRSGNSPFATCPRCGKMSLFSCIGSCPTARC